MKFMHYLAAFLLSAVLLNAPALAATQSFTAPGSTASFNTLAPGYAAVSLQASGSGSGLSFSVVGVTDGAVQIPMPMMPQGGGAPVYTATANGNWVIPVGPFVYIKVVLAALGGGTETFTLTGSVPPYVVSGASVSLAAGSSVTIGAGTPIYSPDISTVTTGGTAVNAWSAGHCKYGCSIFNPSNATTNLCGNASATASGTNTSGANWCAPPGGSVTFPPSATAVISVVTSDSSHPFGGAGSQ